MALRGKKPTPTGDDPATGSPIPPKYLTGRPLAIWREKLPGLPWLTAIDAPLLAMWCDGQAEYEQCGRNDWPTSRRAEHRRLGEAIGMGPANRSRFAASTGADDDGFKW